MFLGYCSMRSCYTVFCRLSWLSVLLMQCFIPLEFFIFTFNICSNIFMPISPKFFIIFVVVLSSSDALPFFRCLTTLCNSSIVIYSISFSFLVFPSNLTPLSFSLWRNAFLKYFFHLSFMSVSFASISFLFLIFTSFIGLSALKHFIE